LSVAENEEKLKKMPELVKVQTSVLAMRDKLFDPDREMKMRLQSRGNGNSKWLMGLHGSW